MSTGVEIGGAQVLFARLSDGYRPRRCRARLRSCPLPSLRGEARWTPRSGWRRDSNGSDYSWHYLVGPCPPRVQCKNHAGLSNLGSSWAGIRNTTEFSKRFSNEFFSNLPGGSQRKHSVGSARTLTFMSECAQILRGGGRETSSPARGIMVAVVVVEVVGSDVLDGTYLLPTGGVEQSRKHTSFCVAPFWS